MKKIIFLSSMLLCFGVQAQNEPAVAAPTPTVPAANVISMFSNAYTNVTVNTWRTDWSSATLEEVQIQGNDTKKYSLLDFVGIETTGANSIDATSMTTLHLDMWSPNVTTFRVKLVDFGANNAFAGGDDSEHEIVINNPALGEWVSLAIPLANFTGLTSREHLSQMILSCLPTAQGIVFVDNVYFSSTVVNNNEPSAAAPTPTALESNVISMFSNAYTNVAVDTWKTVWSNATLEDIQIQGNDTKKYSALDFVGIETVGANSINATEMTTFHLDMWSPNVTTFRIKLVDFGADNAFAGGDDSEHEIIIQNPALGQWVSLAIPLSDFTGLTSREHLSQMILSCLPTAQGIVYIDNVYFSATPQAPNEPMTAAPTPTIPAANVISMFSNAYTNVAVNTWRTDWSSATLEDIQIQGNDTKKYSALDFVGIETTGANSIDASNMTTFHLDMWSPNVTTFRVKLVDFGADNGFAGGDDSEHEIIIENPALGEWVSLAIPLSDFVGLTSREHLSQLILSCLPTGQGTVFVDNVYFSNGTFSNDSFERATISVYPNPTQGTLFINASGLISQYEIYNITGQKIVSQNTNSNQVEINTSNLQSGVYLLKTEVNGQVSTQKFVKN
jgi:hypothetical protein